jgi:hypothetical protein
MTVDGGRSWHYTDFAHPGTTTGHYDCIDPSVTVTRDGTFYVIYFFGFGTPQADPRDVRGEAQVRRSTDGGRTWQAPTPALTQWQWADNVGAGRAYPTPMCPPTDRVWLTSDYTTGTLYASGNGDGAAPCDEALAVTGESQGRYVVASHDGGRTWTLPAAMGQGMQAAAFGTLVVTTTSDGAAYTFKLSRDDGKTWTSHRVPVVAGSDAVNPLLPGFSQLDAPKTAADPTRRGRYAVLVPTHATTQYDVLVTDDYGRSWTRRDVLTGGTGTVTEPALAYGPRGDLAASWRLVHSDGRYDVFAVVSIDGGHTFGRAARLTSGPSPASSATLGDDCQCFVYADGTRLWTAWGDNRSGNREVFYATAQYRPARAR